MTSRLSLLHLLPVVACVGVVFAQPPPPPPPGGEQPPTQQPSTVIEARLTGDPGAAPRMAVPDFLALSADKETQEIARTIAEVLWADLLYEREFTMIPRDTYRTIPVASSIGAPPFDRWRELGADGLVVGAVSKSGDTVRVEMRLYQIATRRQIYAREYTGSAANARLYAHTISDEIHLSQRNLRGVARTKLTFVSDRNRERVTGTVENRDVKEVYMADYDGFNQRRITVGRQLNNTPTWSPDGRAIAYTSWRTGFMDIFISRIYEGTMSNPAKGTPNAQNSLPMFSPDGTRLAFTSNRDGNPEIYVMNVDGTGLRRITNHPAIDTTPTWSPTGTQLAFTSDRGGSPSIYIIGVDGLGLRRITFENSDRATWSPAPRNEIAYTARTGPGYDIKVLNLATNEARQLTFGQGTNESPAWAPNGRHLAFWSTRAGNAQIFTVDYDGANVRQITRDGNNQQPHWSQ
jgi:TolB protein